MRWRSQQCLSEIHANDYKKGLPIQLLPIIRDRHERRHAPSAILGHVLGAVDAVESRKFPLPRIETTSESKLGARLAYALKKVALVKRNIGRASCGYLDNLRLSYFCGGINFSGLCWPPLGFLRLDEAI